jgi:hypothetical protein
MMVIALEHDVTSQLRSMAAPMDMTKILIFNLEQ